MAVECNRSCVRLSASSACPSAKQAPRRPVLHFPQSYLQHHSGHVLEGREQGQTKGTRRRAPPPPKPREPFPPKISASASLPERNACGAVPGLARDTWWVGGAAGTGTAIGSLGPLPSLCFQTPRESCAGRLAGGGEGGKTRWGFRVFSPVGGGRRAGGLTSCRRRLLLLAML